MLDKTKPLTADFLNQEFIKKNKTALAIMKEYGLSASKVIKRLKKLGIKKPLELRFAKGNVELKTKEALEKMYLEEKLSIAQISERLGLTTGSTTNLFKRRGISISKELRYARRRNNYEKRSENLNRRRQIKLFEKEATRQRLHIKGAPCTPEKKLKLSEKAIERGIKIAKRTSAEVKTKILLDGLAGINYTEQVGIKIFQNGKYITGFVPDYLLNIKGAKFLVILEVDSEYPHLKIPRIVAKDILENSFLTNFNFVVIRLFTESISAENLLTCIDEAKRAYRPMVIKFNKTLEKDCPSRLGESNYAHQLLTFNKTTDTVVSSKII